MLAQFATFLCKIPSDHMIRPVVQRNEWQSSYLQRYSTVDDRLPSQYIWAHVYNRFKTIIHTENANEEQRLLAKLMTMKKKKSQCQNLSANLSRVPGNKRRQLAANSIGFKSKWVLQRQPSILLGILWNISLVGRKNHATMMTFCSSVCTWYVLPAVSSLVHTAAVLEEPTNFYSSPMTPIWLWQQQLYVIVLLPLQPNDESSNFVYFASPGHENILSAVNMALQSPTVSQALAQEP